MSTPSSPLSVLAYFLFAVTKFMTTATQGSRGLCRSCRKAEGYDLSQEAERWTLVLSRFLCLFILEPGLAGCCHPHSGWVFTPQLNFSTKTSLKDPKMCFHGDSISCHVDSEG